MIHVEIGVDLSAPVKSNNTHLFLLTSRGNRTPGSRCNASP